MPATGGATPVGAGAPAPATMPCPENGARAKKVGIRTVKALVRQLPFRMPPAQYYFCTAPDCDVVYFASDSAAPVFRRGDLLVAVGAKQATGPRYLCYCFGITEESIQEEVARSGMATAAQRITAEVKAGNCACELKNPSGRCCLGEVTQAEQKALTQLAAQSRIR